jgi:hypothetical protein
MTQPETITDLRTRRDAALTSAIAGTSAFARLMRRSRGRGAPARATR